MNCESENKAILVVDDNPMTARWVGHLATQMGYGAVLASDGEQALQCLAEEPFAAVVSDVDMPAMHGFELLRNIRRLYPQMPVALMQVFWDDECRKAARAEGARALLEKPVNLDRLSAALGGNPPAVTAERTGSPR